MGCLKRHDPDIAWASPTHGLTRRPLRRSRKGLTVLLAIERCHRLRQAEGSLHA